MNSKRGSQFLTILPRPIFVCFLVFAYRSPGLQVFRRLSCVDHDCQQCSSPYLQDFYPIWDSVSFHFCLREASLAWNRGRVLESPCCTFLFRALPYFSQGGEEALLQRNVLRGAAVDSRGQPEATRGRAESMLWWCRWCRRCRGVGPRTKQPGFKVKAEVSLFLVTSFLKGWPFNSLMHWVPQLQGKRGTWKCRMLAVVISVKILY